MLLNLTIILTLALSTAEAQSFLNGDHFTSIEMEGDLHLTCHEGSNSVTVRKHCRDERLLPVNEDYFISSENIDAMKVRLIVLHEQGSTTTKTLAFNVRRQQTTQRALLWNTPAERGLLRDGTNKVQYDFFNWDGDILLSGITDVFVEKGPAYSCAPGRDTSYSMYDCYYGDARSFCEKYFKYQNYCQN